MRYLFAAIVVGLIGFAALTASRGGADQPEIVGVDRAELERQGIHLGPPSGRTPKVAPEQARASRTYTEATVRETVLASIEERGKKVDVWVINYDPATIPDISEGPPPIPGEPTLAPVRMTFTLDIIDATTGEFVSGISVGTTE